MDERFVLKGQGCTISVCGLSWMVEWCEVMTKLGKP